MDIRFSVRGNLYGQTEKPAGLGSNISKDFVAAIWLKQWRHLLDDITES